MKRITGVCVFALILLMASCGKNDGDECIVAPDISALNVPFSFEPLQDTLTGLKSKAALVDLLTRNPHLRDYIFRRAEYPNDSVFINELYRRFHNPGIDTLLMETRRVFGDGKQLQAQFQEAFTHIKYYYPDFTPPKVQTVISGLDGDMFVSDSLIIVGLDFFLGKGAKFRPKMYDYLLRQFNPENIVPSCMMIYGISDRFNKTSINDKTVIADMVSYGKSFYFAKHMLPCVPDSTLMWYTPEEIDGARKNQDLIWARLIQDQVLFATSHVTKQKYLGERPKTLEVGEKCPGRIGQWVGWQIVNKYAETHPQTALPAVMAMPDAQALFNESKYRPGK